jgi:hypothetical protein
LYLGGSYMNDLWIYKEGTWTWMSGNSSVNARGSYGDIGVASSSNVVGAREGTTCWTDNDGNLWMFGGRGFGEGPVG